MRNQLDDLPDRLARALATVRWPAPAEIRARARRRTLRNAVTALLAVALMVGSVIGWQVWLVGGETPPVAGDPTAAPSQTGASTVAPSPAPTPTTDPAWIPLEALLQPEDVGPGQRLFNVFVGDSNQVLTTPPFESCPAYAGLGIVAHQEFQFMRWHHIVPDGQDGFDSDDTLFVNVWRYPDQKASIVVDDMRRALAACSRYDREGSEASSATRPAHTSFTWALLDADFAGDESLLIRLSVAAIATGTGEQIGDPIVETYGVVRVGDLVTVISRYSTDEAEIATLAEKAAARLCLASTPRC